MKYDYNKDDNRKELDEFVKWLQNETISNFSRSVGDGDSIRSAIFLFINRALEAHLPDEVIGEVLGVSVVRGGLNETEEELAFDEADALSTTLKEMYKDT